ncbi:uncharacterized protein KY384_003884 [Bacidia gigantensis]|uniref:uncharacterized protein n=1 Tax=Bacidia gigantensis TaxID=2732470 RepID=UPI001D04E61A|nr:uncharacterized protein KY384_003884 [Bacidia gigantensis]KAG8532243.1 hypothetical protein KY384_003884 [Bacidia gigantensis]
MAQRGRSNTSTEDYPPTLRKPYRLEEANRHSYDRRSGPMSFHTRNERSGSFSRSLKKKASKLLRRPESTDNDNDDNLTSLRTVDWSSELDDAPFQAPESSKPQNSLTVRYQPSYQEAWIKQNISLPFDFHHLSAVSGHDYENMQDISPNEFSSEIGTTYPTRNEQGRIRALDLSQHGFSFGLSPTVSNSPRTSRPTTPRRPSDLTVYERSVSPLLPPSPIETQSYHSSPSPFNSRSPTPSTSLAASPEVSPIRREFNHKITADHTEPYRTDSQVNETPFDFSVPHAVTTPDDAAHVLRPPPFEIQRTYLSRVIEEDEISEGRRCSVSTIVRRPSTSESSVRHVKSFPSAQQAFGGHSRSNSGEAYRESIQSSPKKQRRSVKVIQPCFDDAENDVPYQKPQHLSATVKDTDGNWEDIITWCYDQRAEADCNFDFTRAASPPPRSITDEPTNQVSKAAGPASGFSEVNISPSTIDRMSAHQPVQSPSLLVNTARSSSRLSHDTTPVVSVQSNQRHSHSSAVYKRPDKRSSSIYSASPPLLPQLHTATSVPDLQPPSAISNHSSFEACEAMTPDVGPEALPRFPLFHSNSKPNFSKPVGPYSPHVSNDMTPPELYEDLCGEKYSRESWHYGRPEGSIISSPISKSSSQESFSLARRHRSNNSQGSLPDLISGRNSREKVEHFPEQLAENVNGLTIDDSTLHRRSPASLVRDVAQKNLLAKLQEGTIEDACSAQMPLPLHPALRDAGPIMGPPSYPPRKRSESSATGLKSNLKKSETSTSMTLSLISPMVFVSLSSNPLDESSISFQELSIDAGYAPQVILVHLLELLSQTSLGRYASKPKLRVQRFENVNTCLTFIKSRGIQLTNIGAEDIVDGNHKRDHKGNMQLAFDIASKEIGIPDLLDVEDVCDVTKPDERSLMTYIAYWFHAFSQMEKVENAGRRVEKFVTSMQGAWGMQNSFEQRVRDLLEEVREQKQRWREASFTGTYADAKEQSVEFSIYRRSQKRKWVAEKSDLAALLGNIKTKMSTYRLRAYEPPRELRLEVLDEEWSSLLQSERQRSQIINETIRDIKNELRRAFAQKANSFAETLSTISLAIAGLSGEIPDQLSHEANIDENDFTTYTYDELSYELDLVKGAVSAKMGFLENQMVAREMTNLTPIQLEEFESVFRHFDRDGSNTLQEAEFGAALSSLGVVFDEEEMRGKFVEVSEGHSRRGVTFEQFIRFMVDVTEDQNTAEQVFQSFKEVADGKPYVTELDLRHSLVPEEMIEDLLTSMPAHKGPDLLEDRDVPKYDYVGFMERMTLGNEEGGGGEQNGGSGGTGANGR